MINRLTIALAVLAAALGLYAWGQQGHQKAARAAAEAQSIATQRDTAVAALRAANEAVAQQAARAAADRALAAKRIALAERRLAEAQLAKDALNEALRSNPGWADQPVPDGVRQHLAPPGRSGPAGS